jgi:uncharacterized membrane protein YgdD (TMEM256/DUF423 family)
VDALEDDSHGAQILRWINIAAALSGLVALAMLVAAAHPLRDVLEATALERIKLAAFVQLGAACAGLAIANRSSRLNAIAGAMILAGAGVFACTLYAVSLTGSQSLALAAPFGGATLIAGWVVLVFSKPGR